jgi:hypothetical protein
MQARDRRCRLRLQKEQPGNAAPLKIFWRYWLVCGNLWGLCEHC